MKYSIVTGYHRSPETVSEYNGLSGPDEYRLWLRNTLKYAKPERIYVVNGGVDPIRLESSDKSIWFNQQKNLGTHADASDYRFLCGWSAGILLGAMLCYHDGVDMLYKESDCLAFGPYVDRLYCELDEAHAANMIFGQRNWNNGAAGHSAQSLTLIRWNFLPTFIKRYLTLIPNDRDMVTEAKFDEIEKQGSVTRTTMGCDRSRPILYDDECFYSQHLTLDELAQLSKSGLL